ncbi:hypothetical protein GHT09_003957 [Marmota monax]|uniref:Uncharacterized protein n=1 Tax=Marmota monax TaxID=9995 RepID=A0A834QVQ0_MARMO|nr:hypothetical protein GHT09_003957 [Marmota monax]
MIIVRCAFLPTAALAKPEEETRRTAPAPLRSTPGLPWRTISWSQSTCSSPVILTFNRCRDSSCDQVGRQPLVLFL